MTNLPVNCLLWNAQSLNNKIEFLIQLLQDESIDICFVCETWLTSQNNHVTALLKESGFNISHVYRTDRKGGGVAILFKCNYQPKFQKSFQYSSFECIIQTLKINNNTINLTLITIYRHFSESFNLFLEEFHMFLEYVKLRFKYFVIAGDFNVHMNRPTDPPTSKFIDILNTFSLEQYIKSSTHEAGNILDLVITDPNCLIIKDVNVDNSNILRSDHFLVYFNFFCDIESCTREEINYRNFKDINMPLFHSDIAYNTQKYLTEADETDFESCINLYNNLNCATVDKHAPIICKLANTANRPPWMDQEFVLARRERRALYNKWRKDKTPLKRQNYEKSRSNVNLLCHDKKRSFYQDSINSAGNSQKELFKITNALLDSSKKSVLPYSEDYNMLATKFNNYFVEKIETIRKNLDSPVVQLLEVVNNDITTLCSFNIVTIQDILKQINSSKLKTSQCDPIPSFLLKPSLNFLLPSIQHLINTSLQNGSMAGLKESIVTPILKKSGLDQEVLSNYRPVCGGMFVDKVIQRSVLGQLNEHMDLNDLHIPYQSGYKKFHGCETVLLKIVDDILLCLDANKCTILLILDLSAAFDTVDHDELLKILKNEIGLRGTVLEWFKSFLSGRTQVTSVKGCKSTFANMKYGVPQGSVVGPVLFNIYIRNFINVLKSAGFVVHGYADDHQVTSSFRIEFQYHALCHALPKCLGIISQWMSSHFLKLNASKSNLLIFSPRNLSDKLYVDKVYIGNNIFLPVSQNAMTLGVNIDSQLTFTPQINMLISQSYREISNIGKIRKYLCIDNIKCLVNALIVSKIDNCNSLLYGIPDYEINRLQMLQNSCARLIYNRKKYDHVSDLFKELHWLPIKQRIIFKTLLFVYKIFINMAPVYLKECIHIIDIGNRSLYVPRVNNSYGDRAFTNIAPKLWNALPGNLKRIETITCFKSHLKHHLFSNFQEYNRAVNRYRV